MQPFLTPRIVLLCGALVSLPACQTGSHAHSSPPLDGRQKAPAPPVASREGSDRDLERRVQAYSSFGAGLIAQENEASPRALEFFSKAVSADPGGNEALSLDVARRYLVLQDTNRAIAAVQATAALPESSPAAKSLLGYLYSRTGRVEEAIAVYRQVLQQTPDVIQGYQAIIPLLLQTHRGEEALKILDSASTKSVRDPGFWIQLSELYGVVESNEPKLKLLAHQRSLAAAAKADALKPADLSSLQRLAERFSVLGDKNRAEAILQELRERFPANSVAAARLAEMYLREGKTREAREQLEALGRLNPANPATQYYLGMIALDDKDFRKAAERFERAVGLNPDFEPAYADWAAALISDEREADAITVLEKARSKLGTSFRREYLEAVALTRQKRFDDAFSHYLAAEKLATPKQPELLDHRFYFQIGALLERAGRASESEKYVKKALELNPEYPEALNHLGYTWVEQGINLDKGREMIQRALKAEPDNPAYLDSMGWVWFKLGKPTEALPFLRRASELMPKPDATVEEHLGDVLQALGRMKEAKEAWQRSIAVEKNDAVQKKLDQTP